MGVEAIEHVLFPGIDAQVTAVHAAAEGVLVEAAACGRPPYCPSCGSPGRRWHSRYRRRLTERPLAGHPLAISLRVRRFFCERPECRRRTFAERVREAVRRALPDAVQVSDRWHIWQNLCDLALAEVRSHSSCWATVNPPRPGGVREQTSRERWHQVHGLLGKGVGLLEGARRLNLALNTVRRYTRTWEPEALRRALTDTLDGGGGHAVVTGRGGSHRLVPGWWPPRRSRRYGGAARESSGATDCR